MKTLGATKKISSFIAETAFSHFPESAVSASKRVLLDYVSVTVAGYNNGIISRPLDRLYAGLGGREESTYIGSNRKVPAIHAALLNGVNGHALDLDDGHRRAKGHPGVAVIPATLAACELVDCSGKELITAVILGYEVFIRLGTVLNPILFDRGFHTTGVCGAIAAAAAAAKILCPGERSIESALGIAGTQSSGLLTVTHSGQDIKPLNAGKAAHSGILAALLARESVKGPEDVLENKDGFIQAFTGSWCEEAFLKELGETFHIDETYIKLYPACRHTHAAIDASRFLKSEHRLDISQIKKVEVTTYPAAFKLTAKKKMPVDSGEARFNLAFVVALALVKDTIGLDDFSKERITDPRVKEVFYKIALHSDEKFESPQDNIRGALVEVTLTNGKKLKKEMKLPVGEKENPADEKALHDKLIYCFGESWSVKTRDAVCEQIQELEKLTSVCKLTSTLRDVK